MAKVKGIRASKPRAKKIKVAAPTRKTLVTFLLDRTGSMGMIKPATIESFNTYLETLKQKGGDAIEFTFLQFDSVSLDKVCVAEPIKDVPLLTDATYQPRASTPLIDACMKTIVAVEESLRRRDDNPKVVIAFQTDGQENCSREYTWGQLSAKIKAMEEKGWQFNFMGAGINAYEQATQMGLTAAQTMSYDSRNLQNSLAAFAGTASNTASFSQGNAASTHYQAVQKAASGDFYAATHDSDFLKQLKEKAPK